MMLSDYHHLTICNYSANYSSFYKCCDNAMQEHALVTPKSIRANTDSNILHHRRILSLFIIRTQFGGSTN